MKNIKNKVTKTGFSIVALITSNMVLAGHSQTEPVEYLIDFKISGQFTGFTPEGLPVYTINGPGFAPLWIAGSGEVTDYTPHWRKTADLENGQITFSGQPTDPVIRFSCLTGSCNLNLKDGAVLTSDAGVPLEGRAINMWGPVVNSPDFDPVAGINPIRIMGCGGLKEIAGEGKAAGMVGSICFNGVLNFNQNDPSQLTGSSKCTITLHTPADPSIIP
ncbi:MAG: hypothetical protein DIZ80_01725 [endosymbiont of Galathealinum brachiosum]|uniref:Uncharacterized protein n=1 Tax=endosymbiont of Galathealinum brachiosum TaxID=2200906 RepID=A0A370DL93_9GAMM|nr:MAG: hypothetical protein DIZ80_01725 [endosymbiont of Galathealinum brachiosum]